MSKRSLLLTLLVIMFAPWQVVQAQGQELLQNPSFESYYGTAQGNVPVGWTLTSSAPVSSSGHTWPGESRTGSAWKISTTKTVFTAIGHQFVPGVRAGSKLRFSAWANIFTCDRDTSCIDDGRSYRVSDTSSGAQARIGADPKGGTDPNAPSVVWSATTAPFDNFQQMTIDFESQNDNGVTVFLWETQSVGMLLNHVYWDDASLQLLQPGQGLTPTQQFAPMVRPQDAQPDGSIVHTVQAGDTLSSIAYAYKVTVQQIRDLNNLSSDFRFLQIGQKLIIKPPDASAVVSTGEATGAATVAGTETAPTQTSGSAGIGAVVTPQATATSSITIQSVPEASNTPSTVATPEPTIVVMQDTPLPTVVALKTETSVCVTAFDDANTNHWQDSGEKLLSGMALNVAQGAQSVKAVTTTADSPACFTDIKPGVYLISATPPGGYGLTTSGQLEIEVKPGSQLALLFGAANGYKPTPADTLINDVPPPSTGAQPSNTAPFLETLLANSGLIVIGVAGLVLLGGVGLALLLRRR